MKEIPTVPFPLMLKQWSIKNTNLPEVSRFGILVFSTSLFINLSMLIFSNALTGINSIESANLVFENTLLNC